MYYDYKCDNNPPFNSYFYMLTLHMLCRKIADAANVICVTETDGK